MQEKKIVERTADTKLKKELGLLALTTVGVGGMIGSGIFSLPAVMASVAGPSFLYGLLLTGILVTFLALPYTELGSAFPITGGPYALPRLAFGDFGGFTMGWAYFLYAFIGTAAIIDIFVTYLNYYIPGLAVGLTLTPTGIAVAVFFLWVWTAMNILGVKWGGLYAIVTTFGKLIPLLLFAGIGLLFLNFGNFSNQFPFGFTGIGLAMSLGFFSFTGFEAVVIPSAEVKKPGRNIPLAMILTVGIVTAVYMFVSIVFTGMISWSGLGLHVGDWVSIGNLSSPLANVGGALGLPILAAIAIVGAVISTGGCGGDWVLLQGRIPFAMAADNLFFKSMGEVNEKRGTPVKVPLALVVAVVGFVGASVFVYWAAWPWTLVGAILMIIGAPLFYLFKRPIAGEIKRTAWIWVYLVGLAVISYIGDPFFTFDNFLPVGPLGLIHYPYDTIVVAIFSLLIFGWAYKASVNNAPS